MSKAPVTEVDAQAEHERKQWVKCGDGKWRYGRNGASGVLLIAPNPHRSGWVALLQQRAANAVDHGGRWGVPGGAIDDGQGAEESALREAAEETGASEEDLLGWTAGSVVFAPGGWSYTTFVRVLPAPFVAVADDANESAAVAWVPLDRIRRLPLHPGLFSSLSMLEELVPPVL